MTEGSCISKKSLNNESLLNATNFLFQGWSLASLSSWLPLICISWGAENIIALYFMHEEGRGREKEPDVKITQYILSNERER